MVYFFSLRYRRNVINSAYNSRVNQRFTDVLAPLIQESHYFELNFWARENIAPGQFPWDLSP